MKNRVSLLLLVLACLLALAPGASAQDTDCLNLAAEDCAILTAAEANSDNIKSAYLTLAIDFSLGGLETFAPEAAGGIEFHLSGKGPFTGTSVPDPTAMMAGDLGAILSTFNIQMDMEISATMPDESIPATPFSFVIADGNLYFLDPESSQWIGMTGESLSGLVEQSMSGALGAGGAEAMADPTAMMGELPPELLTALSSIDFDALAATPGFLNYQRLADESMMGQTMMPFQFTADFGALFQSADFQAALNQLSQAAMQSGDGSSDAMQIMMFLPMFLQGTTGAFSVTQWVGSSDQYIHQVAIDLNGAMDLSMLAAAAGEANAGQMPPITLDFHFDIAFDQINSAFDIRPPEGAQILTPEMLGMSS